MSWQEKTTMSLRQEFVQLAQSDAANMRLLCRRFAISPKTGYKWLKRYAESGASGLSDRSRRPQRSPTQTAGALEQRVLTLRAEHPTWGPRKLRVLLEREGVRALPATSTLSAILQRHGQIASSATLVHRPFVRFEQAAPNQLWQMDFKGHFATDTARCHPFTVLDDHSRFALGLEACCDQRTQTVQQRLSSIFRTQGLPERITMDNGSPWGGKSDHHFTPLTAWLIRLGVHVSHSRPYHPQTQGKDERFHRTLGDELLRRRSFANLSDASRYARFMAPISELTEEQVKTYVKSNLARYKVPREVEFIDELPRNSTGKILKRELALPGLAGGWMLDRPLHTERREARRRSPLPM